MFCHVQKTIKTVWYLIDYRCQGLLGSTGAVIWSSLGLKRFSLFTARSTRRLRHGKMHGCSHHYHYESIPVLWSHCPVISARNIPLACFLQQLQSKCYCKVNGCRIFSEDKVWQWRGWWLSGGVDDIDLISYATEKKHKWRTGFSYVNFANLPTHLRSFKRQQII